MTCKVRIKATVDVDVVCEVESENGVIQGTAVDAALLKRCPPLTRIVKIGTVMEEPT